VFSPILQTLYKFSGTSGEQVRFAVARTYKAPSGRDLAQRRLESLNNSPVQPDYIGNYLLRPELAWGYDATYERFGKDGAMLSVNASLRKIDDAIRRVVLQDVNGRWVSEPINGGKAESRTLAFEFRLPGKRFTENLKGLDLRGSVNKNWSRVDQVPGPDNRLDQQVPLSATLAFDYRTGALSYGASWAFREGAQIQVSQEQRAKLQTARDIDLYAVWRASANASIRLAVSNLAGTDRITDDSYTNGNERVRRLFVVPYAPKVQLTCELKY
jgi:outer membrane receptor protein involved in Fe transport